MYRYYNCWGCEGLFGLRRATCVSSYPVESCLIGTFLILWSLFSRLIVRNFADDVFLDIFSFLLHMDVIF